MDRQYIDAHHIIARYLADRLSDTERAEFEAYYLEHPEIVRDMEAAARFKAGLMQLQDSGELSALLKPRPWFTHWQAIAAALAVVVVGMSLFVANRTPALSPIASSLQALHGSPSVVASYNVFHSRGSSLEGDFPLPATPGAIELRVLPELPAVPPHYRLELSRIDAGAPRTIGTVDGLTAAGDDAITVYIDSAVLQAGQYRIVVSGAGDTDAAEKRSSFEVQVREPASSL